MNVGGEAFAEFFDRNFAPLYRFALPRVADEDAAEEVVQTTLCRAVRKLASYRGEAALLTWLTTICRREIATYFEQRKKVPPMTDLSDDLPEVRAVTPGSLNLLDVLKYRHLIMTRPAAEALTAQLLKKISRGKADADGADEELAAETGASVAMRRLRNPGPAISAVAMAGCRSSASASHAARSRGATLTFFAVCRATFVA